MATTQTSGRKKRVRRRRCRHCDELFQPNARVGVRQKYCSDAECQRARKRDYQREFRRTHPSEDRARHLREKVARVKGEDALTVRPPDPVAELPWDEIAAEIGVVDAVILHGVIRYAVEWNQRRDRGRNGTISSTLVA